MNLFILRHGKAYDRSRKWTPDSRRPLTPAGEEKMFDEARGMAVLGLAFDLILTSPYARAARTAQIVAEVLKAKKKAASRSLIAEADPKNIIDEINARHSARKNVLLTGHEPFLSRLISILLTGHGDAAIDLKKGGLCKLSIMKLQCGRCASLHWLMTPRQLAGLGRAKA